jgi:hypothetical protein
MQRKKSFVLLITLFILFSARNSSASILFENFDNFTSNFSFNGSASQDLIQGIAVLTQDNIMQTGSVFYKTPVEVSEFTASFDFYAGSRFNGGDGMTFAVIDSATKTYSSIGLGGSGLGYQGLNGFAIEFDTSYTNYIDVNNNHLGFDLNGSVGSVAIAPTIPILETNTLHHAQVNFNNGAFSVYLDYAATPINYTMPSFTPFTGYFGFTAATGIVDNYNKHYVDNFRLETPDVNIIPEPASLLLVGIGLSGMLIGRRSSRS